MVNLDEIMNKTIDFTLKDELIKVQQPSMSVVKKINRLQSAALDQTTDELFNTQVEIITEMLNNNSSGKKFTHKQIEALPMKVQNLILTTVTDDITKADNDPN